VPGSGRSYTVSSITSVRKFIISFNKTFAHGAQEPHCQRCELSIAGTFRKIDGAHELHCQRCEFSVTDDSGKITPPNKFNKVD
jgi:hypothetical protein